MQNSDRDRLSIRELIKSVVDDARELIRQEVELARAEVRQEISKAKMAALALGAAAITGLLGFMLFLIALAGAIAWLFAWPTWAGYGTVAIGLLLLAGGLAVLGRYQVKDIRPLPQTTGSLKENVAWLLNKSASK